MRGSVGNKADTGPVSVIGGSNIDILAKPEGKFFPGTSNRGTVLKNAGGVGGNIARILSLLQVHTEFYSVVGDDREGAYIIDSLQKAGVDTGGLLVSSKEKTGSYAALQDAEGTLIGAVSDMGATELLLPEVLQTHKEKLLHSSMIAADTNLPQESLDWLSELCRDNSIPFLIEPVSREKARKILDLPASVQWISPSEAEFIELFRIPGEKPEGEQFDPGGPEEEGSAGKEIDREELESLLLRIGKTPGQILHLSDRVLSDRLLQGTHLPENILLTLGPRGAAHLALEDEKTLRWRGRLYSPYRVETVSDNGAGDAFFAGFIAALQHGSGEDESILYGLAAAAWVLQHPPETLGGLDFSKLKRYIQNYETEH